MTDDAFLFIFWVLGIHGDGADGKAHPTAELIEEMRRDVDYREEQKAFWEHVWQTTCRARTEALFQFFAAGARYLSDLIGADVPVLAPREVVEASVGIHRGSADDTLLIGKVMQRAIRTQLDGQSREMTAVIVAEIQKLMMSRDHRFVPTDHRYLDTDQMAANLGLAPKTVRKLCNQGKITARKLAGGEWRTTQEDLDNSPYLRERNGRGRAKVE